MCSVPEGYGSCSSTYDFGWTGSFVTCEGLLGLPDLLPLGLDRCVGRIGPCPETKTASVEAVGSCRGVARVGFLR